MKSLSKGGDVDRRMRLMIGRFLKVEISFVRAKECRDTCMHERIMRGSASVPCDHWRIACVR